MEHGRLAPPLEVSTSPVGLFPVRGREVIRGASLTRSLTLQPRGDSVCIPDRLPHPS